MIYEYKHSEYVKVIINESHWIGDKVHVIGKAHGWISVEPEKEYSTILRKNELLNPTLSKIERLCNKAFEDL